MKTFANHRAILLSGLILMLGALTAYHNSFGVPFLLDDGPSILENPSITHLWPLTGPLSPPPNFGLTVSGRPLLNLSLALNFAISGTDVGSYHAINLLVHVLAGLTLFGVVRRTLLLPVFAGKFTGLELPVALVTALLWTLHPLQTEAVTYVIQRAESLMGLFYLLALYGFVRALDSPRPQRWLAVSIGACLLGAGCKEVIVTAPLVIFIFDRTFAAGSFRVAWQQRRWFYAGLMATWLPLAWLVMTTGGDRGGTFDFSAGASGSFWATQLVAVTRYLRLSLWPQPLIFEYGIFHAGRPSALAPEALTVFALIGATGWAWRKRPVPGFFGAAFLLILAPTSLVPGVTQVIVEHRMYLPLAPVMALLVGGSVNRFGGRVLIFFAMLSVLAGWLTFQRNADYRDDLTLWRDTVEKRPASARAQGSLGTAYFNRGDLPAAVRHYLESIRLDPESAQIQYNLGLALGRLGRTEEAIPHFEAAVRIIPHFAQAYAGLAAALVGLKRSAEATVPLRCALRFGPALPETHHTHGLVLTEQGHLPEAAIAFEEAIRLKPDYVEARLNLAILWAQSGRGEDALAQLQEAVRLRPDFAAARCNLGIVYAQLGRLDQAVAQLAEALRLQPDDAVAHYNLGSVFARLERWNEAKMHCAEAVRLAPGFGPAREMLARLRLVSPEP